MVIQETHKDSVPHIPVAEGTAQPETIGLSELVQRLIIRGNCTGQLGRGKDGDQAENQGESNGKETVHGKGSSCSES